MNQEIDKQPTEERATEHNTISPRVIKDKAPRPSGVLPKNLQAFVAVGGALLLVIVMALTGHRAPVPVVAQSPTTVPNLSPLNTEKISAFEKQIEDTQRSTAPQTEAALLREQKQSAAERGGPAQPFPSSPYGTPVTAPNTAGAYPPGAYASALPQPAEGETTSNTLKDEQRKRRYLSLFSDNVALTYRKEAAEANSANSASPLLASAVPESAHLGIPQDQLTGQAVTQLAQENQMLAQMQQAGFAGQAQPATPIAPQPGQSKPAPNSAERIHSTPQTEFRNSSSSAANSLTAPDSVTKYILFEGTILETVLINRLDGSFSGPVECLVSGDVYSHDREHLLIPAGSKVLGEAAKVDTFGQARLAVVFHRLIMPDGYSISLDQFKGLDQEGATALKDKVNNHYTRIFGTSLALGVLGGAAQIGTGNLLNANAADRIRQGFGTGLADAGEQILDRFLNILPTVTIREGTRVKIFLSDDVLLPDYHDHNLLPTL